MPSTPPPMLLGRLNHVGIACPSIEAALETYARLYGATVTTPIFDVAHQGVRAAFIKLANTEIELIEPLGPDSLVHAFLKRHPRGGQHHLAFEVEDIIAARDAMRARGATVLGNGEPRIGVHGVPVIFIHPHDTMGVLIELMATPNHA